MNLNLSCVCFITYYILQSVYEGKQNFTEIFEIKSHSINMIQLMCVI